MCRVGVALKTDSIEADIDRPLFRLKRECIEDK